MLATWGQVRRNIGKILEMFWCLCFVSTQQNSVIYMVQEGMQISPNMDFI